MDYTEYDESASSIDPDESWSEAMACQQIEADQGNELPF